MTARMTLTECKTDPELLRKLDESKEAWKNMSAEEKRDMIEAQRQSWANQDRD